MSVFTPVESPPPSGTHCCYCCCSVAQVCPALCDPKDYSTPGFPVLHCLPELAQTHVHWVFYAIQPSCPLVGSFSSCLQSLPALGSFPVSQIFEGCQSIRASASVPPMNIQDWSPLGLVWSLFSPRDSEESSPVPEFRLISSLALSFLYGPTLTSICDYWKNHSFDCMDLCWQSSISAF